MRFSILLLSLGFFSSSVHGNPTTEAVAQKLEDLTVNAWTDRESWNALAEGIPQLAVDLRNGDLEPYLETSVLLTEQILSTVDNWDQLSATQQTEFMTSVGYYTIASLVALKLGMVLGQSAQDHGRKMYNAVLQRAGYRMGPVEPKSLPGFLRSSAYQKLQEEIEALPRISRKRKRKLRAYFRAQSIFIATKKEAYNVPEPRMVFDFQTWRSKLENAYGAYRERIVQRRWERMPMRHHRLFGRPTPHIDEVLKTIVDFTRDTLSVSEQKKLLSHLESLAYDFSKVGRSQRRKVRSRKISRYIRMHRDEFLYWRDYVQQAVRMDDRNPFTAVWDIPIQEVSAERLQRLSDEMRTRFSRLACHTGFKWLGATSLDSADPAHREARIQREPAKASK